MKAGQYQAKITDYGLVGNKAGDGASVFVTFTVENEGNITWYGSLKEGKAFEITYTNLLEMGFNGVDPTELSAGPDIITPEKNKLITTDEIQIYVDTEVNHMGRDVMRVKRIGEGKQLERLQKEEFKKRINSDKLKLQAMEILKSKKPRERKDDEIPFG